MHANSIKSIMDSSKLKYLYTPLLFTFSHKYHESSLIFYFNISMWIYFGCCNILNLIQTRWIKFSTFSCKKIPNKPIFIILLGTEFLNFITSLFWFEFFKIFKILDKNDIEFFKLRLILKFILVNLLGFQF